MNQAEALYHLQQIDLQILRTRKRLDEITALLGDNQVVLAAQNTRAAAEKKLSPIRTQLRNLELEAQSTIQKAGATEERLYSGSVKNPKEMQEMQVEIDSLKRRHQELEDRTLEMMVSLEEAETTFQDAQTALDQVEAEWRAQNKALVDEQERLQTQIQDAQAKRKTALTNVKPESLKTYDTMKGKKANQPVALLQGRSCAACGIEQTLAIETEVRRGQSLATCLNCGRILAAIG
jgi:uncharacterized protein